MKFHPILFSTPMVQAILESRKTMTRRLVKPQPEFDELSLHKGKLLRKGGTLPSWYETGIKCPYGQVGDVLWVREEHLITFSEDRKWITVAFKDGTEVCRYYKDFSLKTVKNLYRRKTIGKWQRARFLPKEMARIFLRNTNVRVERLQDITEQDAKAEGIDWHVHEGVEQFFIYPPKDEKRYLALGVDFMRIDGSYVSIESGFFNEAPAKNSFLSLWGSINGGDPWIENPWVWAMEFERIDKPENF